jgi:hypothetical protein
MAEEMDALKIGQINNENYTFKKILAEDIALRAIQKHDQFGHKMPDNEWKGWTRSRPNRQWAFHSFLKEPHISHPL